MIPAPIHAENCGTAWYTGARLIAAAHGELSHLLLQIDQPTLLEDSWLEALDAKRYGGDDQIDAVINTVFPRALAARHPNRTEFYERYRRILDRYNPAKRGLWGTYFSRLTNYGAGHVNQIENIISKLNLWTKNSKTGLLFHVSDPTIDALRTRGGPCLHYGQFFCRSGRLDMTVVYRNHDYANKAPGNFIALGQLLGFICEHTGRLPGTLTCHSIHAFSGSPLHVLQAMTQAWEVANAPRA